MDPRHRRRTPAATARLIALALANLALLVLLWRAVGDDVLAWATGPKMGQPQAMGSSDSVSSDSATHASPEGESGALVAPATGAREEAGAAITSRRPAPLSPASLGRLKSEFQSHVQAAIRKAVGLYPKNLRAEQVTVAIHVREVGAPRASELSLRSDAVLRPASNMKLATTAAALVLLGPHWQFETKVEGRGTLADGNLRGDLVVRAAGDPLYDPRSNGSVEHLLAPLIADLRNRGLRVVEGDLVLDEGSFPKAEPAPAWPEPSQHWTEYCALAAGFSVNRGCLSAQVESADAGAPARVRVQPEGHGWPEALQVETVKSGGSLKLAVLARAGRVSVRGTIPANVDMWTDAFAHPDPVELFGNVLLHELQRGGIRVLGSVRRERATAAGTLLATLRSCIASVLGPINTDSTNAVADQLFLATGLAVEGTGTREAAARAGQRALERLGVPATGFQQIDGSGLSRDNRASARQIVALLEGVLELPGTSASLYLDSLAVGGETGTLAKRMRSMPGRVLAKTGYIDGSSALSGFALTADGRTFVFSILVEYPDLSGLNQNCWKGMQDQIVRSILEAAP